MTERAFDMRGIKRLHHATVCRAMNTSAFFSFVST